MHYMALGCGLEPYIALGFTSCYTVLASQPLPHTVFPIEFIYTIQIFNLEIWHRKMPTNLALKNIRIYGTHQLQLKRDTCGTRVC